MGESHEKTSNDTEEAESDSEGIGAENHPSVCSQLLSGLSQNRQEGVVPEVPVLDHYRKQIRRWSERI